ncbi:MAG: hypothetical protein ACK59Y_16460 [Betaproteobacteria bacterium]|jgi:hypothetical protein|nr:hypothetical protein [Betaproteobacteria bacterium]
MTDQRQPEGGFDYSVSDEQLAAFAKLTMIERLRWVEEARLFTLAGQTPETRERMERLLRGETII